MHKRIIQFIVALFAILSIGLITSCKKPNISRETLAIEVSLFLENEQAELALDLLSQHAGEYAMRCRNPQVAGLSHLQLNDPASAAPFFESALILNPADDELLLCYQSKKDAGLDFNELLMQVAQKVPRPAPIGGVANAFRTLC